MEPMYYRLIFCNCLHWQTVKRRKVTYVAKKSTRTGFSFCSTLASKSFSSWIVTIWLEDTTALVWKKEADCRLTLNNEWLFCAEINFVDDVNVDKSLIGIRVDPRSTCLPTCSVILDAISINTTPACCTDDSKKVFRLEAWRKFGRNYQV